MTTDTIPKLALYIVWLTAKAMFFLIIISLKSFMQNERKRHKRR